MNGIIEPKLYMQTDSKWADIPYATGNNDRVGSSIATIGNSGCGPSCMAIVISSLTGQEVTPKDTCAWSLSHGYKATGEGTYHTYFEPQGQVYDISVTKMNSSNNYYASNQQNLRTKVLTELHDGNWVVAVMGKSIWTTSGHFVVAWYCDDTYVYIKDPYNTNPKCSKSEKQTFLDAVKYFWLVDVKGYLQNHDIGAGVGYSTITIDGKSKVLFIGDYRTIAMNSVADDLTDTEWVCKSNGDYNWLIQEAAKTANSKIDADTGVCFLLGINDMLKTPASNYSKAINTYATKWKLNSAATYFVSINPVGNPNTEKHDQLTNEKIIEYNQKIRDGLNSEVGYIDTFNTIVASYSTTDGLRFDNYTSKVLYNTVIQSVRLGQVNSISSPAIAGGTPIQIDYTKLNPYLITLDRNSSDLIEYDKLKDSGVVGAIIEGGCLYTVIHTKYLIFKQPKFDEQRKQIEKNNLEYGYFFTIRSQTLAEAKSELHEIILLTRHYPCKLGIWLKLEFSSSQVDINNQIIDYFQKQLIKQGYKAKIGFYIQKEILKTFTWNNYKDEWLLWIIDHIEDTSEIKRLLDPEFFDIDQDAIGSTSGGVG